MTEEDEKKLLDEIQSHPEKFGLLYDEYYDIIFSYIFRRIGNYELARDIAADTFLKAYLKIHFFEWRGFSIMYWFFRIATNEMNLFFRKNKYQSNFVQFAINKNAADLLNFGTVVQEKEMLENELKQHKDFLAVQVQLKHLSIAYQEVIALRYFEQKSIKEIALILNKKEGTIKSLLSRGIEKLKNLL